MKVVCTSVLVILLCLAGRGLAAPIEWKIADGGNGHYYDRVEVSLSWSEATTAAQTSWPGRTGHLMTITSQAELDFLEANLSLGNDYWLGGYQDLNAADYSEPAGGWRWLTGEPFEFTAWSTIAVGGNDNEPNNFTPDHFMSSELSQFNGNIILRVNDAPEVYQDNKGYYVEYSAIPEPSAWALLAIGLITASVVLRQVRP
jgi:hypothetical protein